MSRRQAGVILALIATLAVTLRAAQVLLAPGGPLAAMVGYDPGVYFSGSALLAQGQLPYRDFVLVHPPGLHLLLAPLAGLSASFDPARIFLLSRFAMVALGAANTVLLGALGARAFGWTAGLTAALVYATHPEALSAERGPHLEPFLNLFCLIMAWAWLAGPERGSEWRRSLAAGIAGGVALAVKLWAATWIVAALVSTSGRPRLHRHGAFVLGVVAGFGLLTLPLIVSAPEDFFSQVVSFQMLRPDQGPSRPVARLLDMLEGQSVTFVVAAVASGLVLLPPRPGVPPAARFFASVHLLTLASFLLSPSYFHRYASHLAVSAAVLVGLTVAWVAGRAPGRHFRRLAPAALLALAIGTQAGETFGRLRSSSPEQLALAQAIRTVVPRDSCLFTLEPGWGLVGGRLPDAKSSSLVVDADAGMVLAALQEGLRSPDHLVMLHSTVAQRRLRGLLERCRFFVMGERGTWQLSDETQEWVRSNSVRRHPPPGRDGIVLWERRDAGTDDSAPVFLPERPATE